LSTSACSFSPFKGNFSHARLYRLLLEHQGRKSALALIQKDCFTAPSWYWMFKYSFFAVSFSMNMLKSIAWWQSLPPYPQQTDSYYKEDRKGVLAMLWTLNPVEFTFIPSWHRILDVILLFRKQESHGLLGWGWSVHDLAVYMEGSRSNNLRD
jgi:hypothetical protein